MRHALLVFLVLVVPPVSLAQSKSEREYAFALPPLEILDRLGDFGMGQAPVLPADERALLIRAWLRREKNAGAGTVEAAVIDALLFAGGVADADVRKTYQQRFQQLAAQGKGALAAARSPYQRGELLMTFLHKGVMNKGYRLEQTLWHDVFDSNTFNCVSATAMVYLVGVRLGLELRPMSIPGDRFTPGHATLDLLDGVKRLHVEATNPDGFDWEMKLKRPGVFVIGFTPDRRYAYEVSPLGIAAMIYSNRAVELARSKNPDRLLEARYLLAALTLEPADRTSTNNLLALLANWGPELAKDKKWEEAVRVARVGETLAPRHLDLRNNHRALWTRYVQTAIEARNDAAAVALVDRARRAIPDHSDFRAASVFFIDLGERLRRDKGWEAGLEAAERGLKVLPADEAGKMRSWRTSVFRRWSQELLARNDADGALALLARAHALAPQERDVADAIAYHVQEALKLLATEKSLPAAIEHYQKVGKQFPGMKELADLAWAFAQRRIDRLSDEKKYSEALAAVASLEPLVGKEKLPQLGGFAYDCWGRRLVRDKQWAAAIDRYREGIQSYPQARNLSAGAVAAVHAWGRTAIQARMWDEAIAIYRQGLEFTPGDFTLTNNIKYCEAMKLRK